MVFLNSTGLIGTILAAGTTSMTGSMEATLFLVFIVCLAVSIAFGIPLEFFSIIILPLCLSIGAYYSSFMIPIVVILIFMATLIAKNWLFK